MWNTKKETTISYFNKEKLNNPRRMESISLGTRIPLEKLNNKNILEIIQDMFIKGLSNIDEILPFDQVGQNYFNEYIDIGLKIVNPNYCYELEKENKELKEKIQNKEYFIKKAFESIFNDSYKDRLKKIITDKENEINLYDDLMRMVINKLNFSG